MFQLIVIEGELFQEEFKRVSGCGSLQVGKVTRFIGSLTWPWEPSFICNTELIPEPEDLC